MNDNKKNVKVIKENIEPKTENDKIKWELIRKNKAKMRSTLKEIRKEIPTDKKHSADLEIISRFLMTEEYHNAKQILCYAGTKYEIDTSSLIYASFANGKKVALPRCNGERLDFYYIESLEDLTVGSYGIMEPDIKKCKKVADFRESVLVAPGLGFGPDGRRIGYGKGYYDRFIAKYSGKVIGLCYYPLVKLNIPVEETDCKIDVLITEKYTRNI